MTTQDEYTPKLEMDRTTVDGLILSQSKLLLGYVELERLKLEIFY